MSDQLVLLPSSLMLAIENDKLNANYTRLPTTVKSRMAHGVSNVKCSSGSIQLKGVSLRYYRRIKKKTFVADVRVILANDT